MPDYICPHCGEQFDRADGLRRAIPLIRSEAIVCPGCDYVFGTGGE